jgi:hypothetical protein
MEDMFLRKIQGGHETALSKPSPHRSQGRFTVNISTPETEIFIEVVKKVDFILKKVRNMAFIEKSPEEVETLIKRYRKAVYDFETIMTELSDAVGVRYKRTEKA